MENKNQKVAKNNNPEEGVTETQNGVDNNGKSLCCGERVNAEGSCMRCLKMVKAETQEQVDRMHQTMGKIVMKLSQITEEMDLDHILYEVGKTLKLEEGDK